MLKKALLILSLSTCVGMQAQVVSVRTDYAANAVLNTPNPDRASDRYRVQADFATPLTRNYNKNLRMPVWSVRANAGYTRFAGESDMSNKYLSEVTSASVGINFIKEITPKWYALAFVSEGIHSAPNNVHGSSFFFNGGAFGVYRFNSGFHLGMGFIASEMYGVIPMIYINWKSEGRFSMEVGVQNFVLGYRFNDRFKLNMLPYKYEGVFSAVEYEGSQSRVFRSSNIVSVLQPEFKFGKSTLLLEAGVSWRSRTAIRKKSLSGSYNSNKFMEIKKNQANVQFGISYRYLMF